MNKYFPILILCITFSGWTISYGQTEADALLHSQYSPVGTARSLGLAGAFSAVGADMSAAALNPAGLGLYNRSEFVITPAYRITNSNGSYLGSAVDGSKNNLGIPNFGISFHNERYIGYGRNRQKANKGLISYSFAFGNNQLQNYNREAQVTTFNELSSVSDLFTERADGIFYEDLIDQQGNGLANLAWNTFSIDTLANRGGTSYLPAFNNGGIQQQLQIRESGRHNEWFFGLGANFSDKFYLGGTIGLQAVRYEREFIIIENDTEGFHEFYQNNPDDPNFPLEFPSERLEFANNYTTTGNGINARIGAILRPVDAVRIGLSVQTPTFLILQDQFGISDTKIAHTYQVTDPNGNETLLTLRDSLGSGTFDYNLSTPLVATAGIMILIKKQGFISADVDYINYSNAELSSSLAINDPNYYSFELENENIGELFQAGINYRLGGEFRYEIFRFRAGAGIYTSALTDAAEEYLDHENLTSVKKYNTDRMVFALGLGVRQPNYYIDVTFINQQVKDKLSPYSLSDPSKFAPTLLNDFNISTIALSIGLNF